MFSNSPDKYAGIVTSKYPFTKVNPFRIKQATAARSITSSLRSRMVQLTVWQLPCSKAAKMFKKSAIIKQQSPVLQARDLEFWEAVGRVPFDLSENSENLNRWFLLNGKRPWLRLVACLCMQIKSAPGVGLWLNCVKTFYGGESCFVSQTLFWKLIIKQVIYQRSCLTGAIVSNY